MSALIPHEESERGGHLWFERLRARFGIRDRAQISSTKEGRAARRGLGRHMERAARAALALLRDGAESGAFGALPFGAEDLRGDFARAEQIAQLRRWAEALKRDLDAEHADACEQIARKVDLLWRTRKAVLGNPGAVPWVRDLLRQAGQELEDVLTERAGYMGRLRERGLRLRAQRDLITDKEQQIAGHERAARTRALQRDLRLRQLQGEALRPEDLVIAPAPGSRTTPSDPG